MIYSLRSFSYGIKYLYQQANQGYAGLLDILCFLLNNLIKDMLECWINWTADIPCFLLNKLIRTAGLLGILDCMFPPKQANQDLGGNTVYPAV